MVWNRKGLAATVALGIAIGGAGLISLTRPVILPTPAFTLLSAAAPHATVSSANFCTLANTHVGLTGAYWCLNGDGTQTGATLTAGGSPGSAARASCSNGPACATLTSISLDGVNDAYATADVAAPLTHFSVCFWGRQRRMPAVVDAIVNKDDEGASRGFIMNGAGTGYTFNVFNAAGSNSSVTANSSVGVDDFLCISYGYVSTGSDNRLAVRINNETASSISNSVGPMAPSTAAAWTIGKRDSGAGSWWATADVYGALFTEKEISESEFNALRNVLQPRLTGSGGEAFTTARNSHRLCTNAAGSAGTYQRRERSCVNEKGVLLEPAYTNKILMGRTFSNAAWTKSNVTATADTTTYLALDGSVLADTLQSTVAGGYITQATAARTTNFATASLYVRSTTGTQDVALELYNNTGTATCGTIATLSATTTWQRLTVSCNAGNTTDTLHMRFYPAGVAGTGTVVADYAQEEEGLVAHSAIHTTNTTLSSVREDLTYTAAAPIFADLDTTVLTFAADYTPIYSGTSPGQLFMTLDDASTCTASWFALDTSGQWWSREGGSLSCLPAVADTTTDTGPVDWVAGTTYNIRAVNNATALTWYKDDVSVATSTHLNNITPSLASRLIIGQSSIDRGEGYLENICIGDAVGDCE